MVVSPFNHTKITLTSLRCDQKCLLLEPSCHRGGPGLGYAQKVIVQVFVKSNAVLNSP